MNIEGKVSVESIGEHVRLCVLHESGFFSLCSVTLAALLMQASQRKSIEIVWPGQYSWRNSDQSGKNLFAEYFARASSDPVGPLSKAKTPAAHSTYADINFSGLRPYLDTYFRPSSLVAERKEYLLKKYSIDPSSTLAICYRGTDKWIEVSPISIGYYWTEVRKLLQKEPNLRVLIQTDQKEVRDEGMRDFSAQAFFFEEMPVTYGSSVIHQLSADARGMNNFDLGVTLLAAVLIMAECKYVIMHTGNVGLWTFLYRGSSKNTCQLIPSSPRVVSNLPGHSRLKSAISSALRPLTSS